MTNKNKTTSKQPLIVVSLLFQCARVLQMISVWVFLSSLSFWWDVLRSGRRSGRQLDGLHRDFSCSSGNKTAGALRAFSKRRQPKSCKTPRGHISAPFETADFFIRLLVLVREILNKKSIKRVFVRR